MRLVWILVCWGSAVVGWQTAPAAVYTVGPAGTFAELQQAVDAAALSPGSDSIRVRSGTFFGLTIVAGNLAGNDLEISGGWDAAYAGPDGASTRLSGQSLTAVLRIAHNSGSVSVADLELVDGLAVGQPGSLLVQVFGSAQLALSRLRLSGHRTEGTGPACATVLITDEAAVQWNDLAFSDCRSSHPVSAAGVGLRVLVTGGGRLQAEGLELSDTHSVAANAEGGALLINAQQQAMVSVSGVKVAAAESAATTVFGSGVSLTAAGTAVVDLVAFEVHDNLAPQAQASAAQFGISASDQAQVRLASSLLRSGPQAALTVSGGTGSPQVRLANLTVAGHAGRGLQVFGGAPSLHNSIIEGNGLPSSLPAGGGDHNLGTDLGLAAPVFQSIALMDYRLAAGSPGVDAGNPAPPLGLAAIDLDRRARVAGSAVDIGAYETVPPLILSDGFE